MSVAATCVWMVPTSEVEVGLLAEALHAVRAIPKIIVDRVMRIFGFMVHLRAIENSLFNSTVMTKSDPRLFPKSAR
jgi:hypothetical protein